MSGVFHVSNAAYRYFLQRVEIAKAGEYGKRPLWLADYTYAGRVPTDDQADATKVPAPWDRITCIQHDGDGGLRLPNGRDADFNVMLGGEDRLAELTGQARDNSDADTLPDLAAIAASIAATRTRTAGTMIEDEIAEYRRTREDSLT